MMALLEVAPWDRRKKHEKKKTNAPTTSWTAKIHFRIEFHILRIYDSFPLRDIIALIANLMQTVYGMGLFVYAAIRQEHH